MDARPAGMRQWPDRKAISQGAPQQARKQGGAPTRTAQTPEYDGARERRETDWAAPSSKEPEATRRPANEVKLGRGSLDQPRVRTPKEGQGRSQSELKPLRELEDPTLMGTSKVSSRDGATGSDSNPIDPEEEEKPTLRQRQRRSD